MRFPTITVDPAQIAGVPCIRSLRIPVTTVIGMLADGLSHEEILGYYPDLEEEDIVAALRYACETVEGRGLPVRPAD